MKYYRQDRHYYQLNEKKCMHVNVQCNIINLIDLESFFIVTSERVGFLRKPLIEIQQDEFFAALDLVLFELELPVKS